MTYGESIASRGADVAAKEIDRLQRKIVAAQNVVDSFTKVSAILFLDENKWHWPSYSEYLQDLQSYGERAKHD